MASLTVGGLLEQTRELLELEVLGSADGLAREVPMPDASGPGMVLAGYTERFVHQRIQVLGETEVSYLRSLAPADRTRILGTFLAYPIPCVMVTKGLELPEGMEALATTAGVAILRSRLKTHEFYRRITPFLDAAFAPSANLHGSLADVYGVGLLFTGASGIGKSECVLDLVERGHRLVADDLVIVRRKGAGVLLGEGHPLQRHFMEIRGIGLIDVRSIFGVRAVRQQKRIEVVVVLQEWKEGMVVDRTGLDADTTEILGVEVPRITIPLNPGKNLTVIAEVIAMNHLMRYSGEDPARRFNERLTAHLAEKSQVRRYLLDDDE
ncbi:MAG: HPr kinase/phosphorylase [Gemmatimonadota bacterium]|jgi:HPr kinase/phosphorylase